MYAYGPYLKLVLPGLFGVKNMYPGAVASASFISTYSIGATMSGLCRSLLASSTTYTEFLLTERKLKVVTACAEMRVNVASSKAATLLRYAILEKLKRKHCFK